MREATIEVKIPGGLQVNPAGYLCALAREYQSTVILETARDQANAKSLLSVLGAGIRFGAEIKIICDGPDEETALKALTEAFEKGLGEHL